VLIDDCYIVTDACMMLIDDCYIVTDASMMLVDYCYIVTDACMIDSKHRISSCVHVKHYNKHTC